MNILAEIAAFDGKRTDVLEALAARLSPDPAVIDELCTLAGHDETNAQSAASWLLKRFQDNGAAFSPTQTGRLLDLLVRVSSWDARLHLLQMLPGLTIPAARIAALAAELKTERWLACNNSFVRAWAYNGLAELAERDARLRTDVAALLTAGDRDAAASVRARVRNIRKKIPWVALAAP